MHRVNLKNEVDIEQKAILPNEQEQYQLKEEFCRKLTEINNELRISFEKIRKSFENLSVDNFFIATNPDEIKVIKPCSYYLRNRSYLECVDENLWELFYIDENKEIESRNIIVQLNNAYLEDKAIALHKVKLTISAQPIKAWHGNLKSIVNDLQQKTEIINEHMFNRIAGESLMNLLASDSDKKTELLIVHLFSQDGTELDADIASVIERRFIKNTEKNNNLLILNDELSKVLTSPENEACKFTANKFSILHHWSGGRKMLEAQTIIHPSADIIEKIPTIKKVVLRGCSSADISNSDLIIVQKKCTILGKMNNIVDKPVNENEFLFQQTILKENPDGTKVIRTLLKFSDMNNNAVIKELINVPLNKNGNKLSSNVEKILALSAKDNNLPLLSLPSLKKSISGIKKDWLNNKSIHQEDRKLIKATDAAIKTCVVEKFPINTLADELDKELEKRKIKIRIKGYANAYEAHPEAGIISWKTPKAFIK